MASEAASPFEKYDPNKKQVKSDGIPINNGMLSPENEMQIRDLIYQEFQMRNQQHEKDKEAGIAPLDDNEILYLGPNESLRGSIGKQYLIYNTTTNMFREEDMNKYKKVVTSQEVENILEKENLKEQTQGKIKQ
jgi:hypothetical protein